MSDAPYREHLVRNVEFANQRLARQAEQIERIAGNVRKALRSGRDPIISELGELQAQGTMFDAFCATYAAARQALSDYDAFTAADEEH